MGTPTRGGVAVNLKCGARWGSGPRAEHSAIWGLKELRRQAQGVKQVLSRARRMERGTIWDVSLQLKVTEKLKPKAP